MYNEKVMEAFQNPKNVGEIENPDGIGTVGNESCGDIMQISLRIENDVITSMGIEERVSNSDRETAFFFNYSVGERLSLPPVDQPQEMANM